MSFTNSPGKMDPSLSCVLHLGITKPIPIIVVTAYLGGFGDIEKVDVADCHDSTLSQSSGIKIRYFDSRCTEKVIAKLRFASIDAPVVVDVSIRGREMAEQIKFVSCRPVYTAITPDRTRSVSLADVRWTVGDTIACCQQFGDLNTINNLSMAEALKQPHARAGSISFFDSRATAQFLKIFAAVAEASKQQNGRSAVRSSSSSWNQTRLAASPTMADSAYAAGRPPSRGSSQYLAHWTQNRRPQKLSGKQSYGQGNNVDMSFGEDSTGYSAQGSHFSGRNSLREVGDLTRRFENVPTAGGLTTDGPSGTYDLQDFHTHNISSSLAYSRAAVDAGTCWAAAAAAGEGLLVGNDGSFNWADGEYDMSLGENENTNDYQQGPDYGEAFYKTLLEASGEGPATHY
ncbi:hypothetical protein FOL47_006842 [Perkinsus chesapeaki]|uniref:Uncharacterized protein n=1 Tax=Perkinsus chesapeaki TaxID=330153 RepID=A0A7J6LPF2_PERCH|nr:hypothetical protein FOL47_006842 [Perkinsus chesapeaki]